MLLFSIKPFNSKNMQGKEIKTDFYAEVNKIHLQVLWSTLSMKELLQSISGEEYTTTQSTQVTVEPSTTSFHFILFLKWNNVQCWKVHHSNGWIYKNSSRHVTGERKRHRYRGKLRRTSVALQLWLRIRLTSAVSQRLSSFWTASH